MKKIGKPTNSIDYIQLGPVVPFSFNINLLHAGYEKCEPFHYAGPCYKKAYLIHLVLDGKGKFRCNDKEYVLGKGDVFLITPTDYIYYEADEDEPWEYRWIKYEGSSVKYLFENGGINKEVYSISDQEQYQKFLYFFEEILNLLKKEVAPYLSATGLFYVFLGWFIESFGAKQQSNDKISFYKIQNYINNHFTEDIDMDQIAKFSNYDRSHIYKLFMKNIGCSPKEYISTLRLNLACEMLHETDYLINDIALKTGYKSYISFINAFKKKYGILPTQYRKSLEQNAKENRHEKQKKQ